MQRAVSPEAQRVAAPEGDGLFDRGPPRRLETLTGLVGSGRRNTLWLCLLGVGIAWLPLLVMTALQSVMRDDGSFHSFVSDYGVHARFLVAVPLLIAAEGYCLPRLSAIGEHFLSSGLIATEDRPRFSAIAQSTRRLGESLALEIVVLLLALALPTIIAGILPPDAVPPWHALRTGRGEIWSPAGWWHSCVALPLLLLLVLGWLFRLLLWVRFLWLLSRLPLRIVPAHPDKTGGLRFLDLSVQLLAVIALAMSTILAGSLASRVTHGLGSIAVYQDTLIGVCVVVVLAVEAPLCLFASKSIDAWRRAVLEYDALARHIESVLERKWSSTASHLEGLEPRDFVSINGFNQVASNVYAMRMVPMSVRSFILLLAATLLPFLPLAALSIPLTKILKTLAGVLL